MIVQLSKIIEYEEQIEVRKQSDVFEIIFNRSSGACSMTVTKEELEAIKKAIEYELQKAEGK